MKYTLEATVKIFIPIEADCWAEAADGCLELVESCVNGPGHYNAEAKIMEMKLKQEE